MTRARLLIAAAALTLGAAPVAGAAPPAQEPIAVAPGFSSGIGFVFALAGSQVVYSRPTAGRIVVRARRPGGAARTLMEDKLPAGTGGGIEPLIGVSPGLAASGRRVGLLVLVEKARSQEEEIVASELWGGPPSGRLTRILAGRGSIGATCEPVPGAVAVTGNTLVDVQSSCRSPQVHRVVVRDYDAGGGAVTIATAPAIGDIAAAGRFVAWLQADREPAGQPAPWTIVVYDLDRQAEAYRIPADPAQEISRLQVQADGTVLLDGRQHPPGQPWISRLAYFTLAGPQSGTDVPTPAGWFPPGGHSFAASRIVAAQYPSSGPSSLGLVDLTGAATRIAQAPRGTLGTTVDYDGAHVAYMEQRCQGNTLVRQDASLPASVAGSTATDCPVSIAGGTLRVRGAKVRVPVTCPRGCYGSLALTRSGHRLAAAHTLSVPPAGRATVTFTLTASARRAVSRGTLAATVTATTTDLRYRTTAPTGFAARTTRAAVRLRCR